MSTYKIGDITGDFIITQICDVPAKHKWPAGTQKVIELTAKEPYPREVYPHATGPVFYKTWVSDGELDQRLAS